MISSQPNVTPTTMYTIAETCRLLEMHRDTLRKYTYNGSIHCGFRRYSGRKFYLGSEILRFWRAQK